MAKRVFISFAVEDKHYRDLLKGQSLHARSPFEYTDFSVKQPWSNAWKTQCRQRIRGCRGVIVLISKNTRLAEGARWEIRCALEEGIPVLPIHIHATDNYVPPELAGKRTYRWSQTTIKNFIERL